MPAAPETARQSSAGDARRFTGERGGPDDLQTVQFRSFGGVNLTDARTAINDEELYWLENGITIGNGAIQWLPGVGASIATIAAGIASVWGFTLAGTPVLIAVNLNGSLSQITTGGVVTAIAPANTVDTTAHLTIWQSSPILIVGPTKGYMSWDGTTFTVIDATKLGVSVAVFEGRVWISNGRTTQYTAPATFNDFAAGNGAGSFILTDEAFPGNIVVSISAVEQLWLLGQGGIEAVANVGSTGVAPSVITTFSVTNIVTGLGTNAADSVIGYFRALTFLAPYGVYALAGVTPQKLSDKLDGLFAALTFTRGPAALAVIRNQLALLLLVTYTPSVDPSLPVPASAVSTAAPLLLCFAQGKWFFGTQGALTWITTLLVGGQAQAWGTDGAAGHIFPLFAGTAAAPYKALSKLYDFGLATTGKDLYKLGIEYQATTTVAPALTADNETSSQDVTVSNANTLTFVLTNGVSIVWLNGVGNPLTFITVGLVLSRANAEISGRYLGWSVSGTDAPYRLQAIQMEVAAGREWQAGQPTA